MQKSYIYSLIISFFVVGCSNAVSVNDVALCDRIIDKNYYEICYDDFYKGALFVSYSLDGEKVYANNIEERDNFYIEPSIPREVATSSDDYVGSGYDRGHLASDASFDYTQEALHSVYSMANIIPQEPEVNRESWIDTEYYERQKAREFGSVEVIIGVVYPDNPMQIGEDLLSVPSAYYKSIQNTENGFHECYYYENIPSFGEEDLQDHRVECSQLILNYQH